MVDFSIVMLIGELENPRNSPLKMQLKLTKLSQNSRFQQVLRIHQVTAALAFLHQPVEAQANCQNTKHLAEQKLWSIFC